MNITSLHTLYHFGFVSSGNSFFVVLAPIEFLLKVSKLFRPHRAHTKPLTVCISICFPFKLTQTHTCKIKQNKKKDSESEKEKNRTLKRKVSTKGVIVHKIVHSRAAQNKKEKY